MPKGRGKPGKAIWSGTVSFGLVSVPVDMLPASRDEGVHMHMVAEDGTPLERRYFRASDETPLEWDDIVRGYEVEKEEFVTVEEDELERLAPEKTRDIDLRAFVPVEDLDPMYFERAYYLVPGGSSNKAYRLLAQVMEETGRAGIATFVMRAKEYLTAIIAENGILRAETLRFAHEVRTPKQVGLPTRPAKVPSKDVTKIERAIARLSRAHLDPDDLADTYVERFEKFVAKKKRSKKNVVHLPASERPAADETIIDLVARLQQSLNGRKAG